MKFLIADDHPLFREALAGILRKHFPELSLHECGDFEQTLQALAQHADADLLLLDLNMPGSYELYGLAALRQQFPTLPIAVVSASEDIDIISRTIAYGAAAFIPKSSPSEDISAAVEAVLDGDSWLPEAYRHRLKSVEHEELELANRVASLTPQQYKVLYLVAEGWLNKQIAYDLDITEATVKAHMTNIFRKLNVSNRTQAVVLASRLQLRPGNQDAPERK
jgi:DNA-binding NarL/FixJ family response regulator